jgi:hypothetical protein
MTSAESRLLAFGGEPLNGSKWVRILYLDESGIGKVEKDPMLVVAGVIIHADTQWGVLAKRLDALLSDATPFGVKKPDYLHAKDIFHGSGEFPRDKWDQKRRNKLLEDTGSLVHEFKLPVVWTGVDRKHYAGKFPKLGPADCLQGCYNVAATTCFMQAEMFMR